MVKSFKVVYGFVGSISNLMEHNTLLDPLFELNGAFHKDKQVILLIVKYPALLGLHVFSSFMMVYVP